MLVVSVDTHYVDEPRWSWYGTPLRKTWTTRIKLSSLGSLLDPIFGGGPSRKEFEIHTVVCYMYFTDEEYVMFKLSGLVLPEYDLATLSKGIVYY